MNKTTLASMGLVFGGAMWGIIWIPLRYLEETGLPGAWAGLVMYSGGGLVLLAMWFSGRFRLPNFGWPLLVCGLGTGAAFSLYTSSLVLTDVVRAILLFYLTPIWGTLLGLFFLGERITPPRMVALVMALLGLLIVLGLGEGWPVPRNLGDWLALASGMAWAYGAMKVYQLKDTSTFEQVCAFIFGALVVTVLTMLLAPGPFASGAGLWSALMALPLGLLMAIYLLPMLALTVWPASLLTPGRVGILLMSDVLCGVMSAALWSGEHFGWREAAGSALIIGAAAVEVAGKTPSAKA